MPSTTFTMAAATSLPSIDAITPTVSWASSAADDEKTVSAAAISSSSVANPSLTTARKEAMSRMGSARRIEASGGNGRSGRTDRHTMTGSSIAICHSASLAAAFRS